MYYLKLIGLTIQENLLDFIIEMALQAQIHQAKEMNIL